MVRAWHGPQPEEIDHLPYGAKVGIFQDFIMKNYRNLLVNMIIIRIIIKIIKFNFILIFYVPLIEIDEL
jgi:hypothetical protein